MAVTGTRTEPMDPVDVVWLHMDRPANLMVVNTVLWFDVPVDQASVLEMFGERVVSRFRRFRPEHDAPAEEVIVIVPVNLRPAGAPLPAGLGNQFGLVFVRLPTGETGQGRRRARIKAQMDQVKSSREGAFVYTMLERMGQLPAAVQNAWVDAFAGKATAIVTNVSGPPHQIQIAGTPIAGMMGTRHRPAPARCLFRRGLHDRGHGGRGRPARGPVGDAGHEHGLV